MKGIIAFSLGLLVAVGGVATLEVWCRNNLDKKPYRGVDSGELKNVDELKRLYPEGIYPEPPPPLPPEKRYSGILIRRVKPFHERVPLNRPGLHEKSHRHIIKDEHGEILADTLMLFDKYKRRITPADEKKKATHFVAYFGDSNTNGFGLPPEKTLAQHLSLKLPSARVYDYSGLGLYPYEIMYRSENIDRTEEIPEKEGAALYFFMSYHLLRNMGGLHELAHFDISHKKHAVDLNEKGEIEVGKTFKEDRPVFFWLSKYLRNSGIVRYFNLEFIPRDKDYRVQTAIFKEMRLNLAAQGINKFFVVIHPVQFSLQYAQKLLPYLVEEKIPFIYMGHWRLRQLTEGPVNLIWDVHVSSEANKVIAGGLSGILSKKLGENKQ